MLVTLNFKVILLYSLFRTDSFHSGGGTMVSRQTGDGVKGKVIAKRYFVSIRSV